MQDTQVEVKAEKHESRVQATALKSRFDDAEYERWSENLRKRNASKGK